MQAGRLRYYFGGRPVALRGFRYFIPGGSAGILGGRSKMEVFFFRRSPE